jgi:hypothetical protein
VIVEKKPEVQEEIRDAGFLLSPGDATREDVLRAAGIGHARGLVSVPGPASVTDARVSGRGRHHRAGSGRSDGKQRPEPARHRSIGGRGSNPHLP